MAKVIGGVASLSGSPLLARSLRSVWTLRLALGFTVLLGTIISLLGTSWDIQWHSFVGRDRTLIPPHLMMLSGVLLSGIAALLAVLIETTWARRNPDMATHSPGFADVFHAPLGAYIAGFAALNAAIAFPLDSYWHSLYGIDVSIWAPFHIMILMGMGITALGATYMLLSAARLASSGGARGSRRAGYMGAIVAFATMLSILTLLLIDGLGDLGYITIGNVTFNVFPELSGLLVAWTLVAAVYAIPWRRVALYVTLVYIFFALLFTAFVPPATNYLVGVEHLSYRRSLGIFAHLSLVAMEWPLAIILGAILIDIFFRRAQRKGWSLSRLLATLTVAALIGSLPVVAIQPDYSLQLVGLGAIGFSLTILLGLLGAFVGTWFGQRMGVAIQQVEGEA